MSGNLPVAADLSQLELRFVALVRAAKEQDPAADCGVLATPNCSRGPPACSGWGMYQYTAESLSTIPRSVRMLRTASKPRFA